MRSILSSSAEDLEATGRGEAITGLKSSEGCNGVTSLAGYAYVR